MSAVAKLQAVLGLDPREFKAGMGKATDSARGFQSDIKKIGGLIAASFSVGAIVGFGKSLVTWASDVSEAAQNAGILTSEMMALNQVGLKGGLGIDEMRRMLSKLQTELYSAAEGNEQARKKFENLGLSITDLAGLDPAAMFQKVAKAAMDSGTPISALADIFGDRLGPKAVSALRDLAENGLPAVSTEAAKAADAVEDLGDRWAEMVEKVKQKSLPGINTAIDFAEVEGIVRARAEKKAWKDSSFMDKMGFEGTRKSMAAGEAAVQEWWAKQYASRGENQNRTAAMDKSKKELTRMSQESDVIAEYKKIRAGQEAGNDVSAKTRDNEELMRKEKAEAAKDKEEAAKDAAKAQEDARKENNASYFRKKAYNESQDRIKEQIFALKNPLLNAAPSTMNPDSMARIGGFFGGERAGYDVQSKQLDVLKDIRKLVAESKRIEQDYNDDEADRKGAWF